MATADEGNTGKAVAISNDGGKSSKTLFVEDTVQLQIEENEDPVIGYITRAWHDVDEEDILSSRTLPLLKSPKASDQDMRNFRRTGQLPREFYLFTPCSPLHAPVIAHESECQLLDRAFTFGDVVKRSLKSPLSGHVISIETIASLRPAFANPTSTDSSGSPPLVKDVPGSELINAIEWDIGDFIIYKNCWMGVLDEVFETALVKLENGSVVEVFDVMELEAVADDEEDKKTSSGSAKKKSSSQRGRSIGSPAVLFPGQHVTTKKVNLRKGRWIFGAYDPSVSPTGIILEVKPVTFEVHWICQNMMVSGRFVAVPKPPARLEYAEEVDHIQRFCKSSGGFKDIQGNPFPRLAERSCRGDLSVGDRVRFLDIDAAVLKYNGDVRKIKRLDSQGFDLNVYAVETTKTIARVLWQDKTETVEEVGNLVPYVNIDEHEVYPGEVVVVKPDKSSGGPGQKLITQPPGSPTPGIRERYEEFMQALTTATDQPLMTGELMTPSKIGIVQVVDPIERFAKVRWFVSPNVDVASSILIPGSTTGELHAESEDVSLYEALAVQALSCRRGDIVLITPEKPKEEEKEKDETSTPAEGESSASEPAENTQLTQIAENLRGMVDNGLLSNLSAALGNHSSPQLQTISRLLNQLPLQNPMTTQPTGQQTENAHQNQSMEWIGEIVDLGLDGLITVRLGALPEPRDIRVAIERLHVIYHDEMGFGESDDEYDTDFGFDDDDAFDDDDDDEDDDDDLGIIEEIVTYEGGERLDNGDEDDWLTDYNDEDDDDESMASINADTSKGAKDEVTEGGPLPKDSHEIGPVPRSPPPIPDNVPAPEAISLASTEGTPPRFMVLDASIPTDHAYKSEPQTPMTSTFARRIAREHKILSSSLPEGIFVRTWESRMDLLRVLIVGPRNTPYELAPFIFDFYFGPLFPTSPPQGFFHSWTSGIGRINPNLYEDGKICLSLLGTWHAEKKAEGWSALGSSVLQLLVSLMGLVLVREPWYNEAGFSVYEGDEENRLNSHLYSERAYILGRGFVSHALQSPVAGFEKIIDWLYLPHHRIMDEQNEAPFVPGPQLLKEVIERTNKIVERSERGESFEPEQTSEGVGKISKGALTLLKRHLRNLEGKLEEASSRYKVEESEESEDHPMSGEGSGA